MASERTRLTLEIGGDSAEAVQAVTRLVKALEGVIGATQRTASQTAQAGQQASQALEETAAAAEKAGDALQETATDAGKAAAGLQETSQAADRAEQSLTETATAAEKAGSELAEAAGDAQQASTGLEKTAAAGAKAEKALDRTGKAAKGVGDDLADAGKKGEKAAQSLEERFDRVANRAEKLEQGMTGVGVAVAAAPAPMAGATKIAMDFDAAMRNVDSIAKLSAADFNQLKAQVMALAGDPNITKGPVDLAEGLYQVYSSGLEGQEALDALREAATGATAGLTDTETAATALLAVLNSGVGGVSNAREAMDVLFKTVDLGVLNFEQLAGSIGQVLPTAKQAGVSLQEIGAAVAVMTRSGQSASDATNDLLNLITKIIRPGEEAEGLFKELGIEYGVSALQGKGLAGVLADIAEKTKGNAQAQQDLFPDLQASRGLLSLLTDGGGKFRDMLREVARATEGLGAKQSALDRQLESSRSKWEEARKKLEITAIAAGEKLLPELNRLLDAVSKHPEVATFAVQVGAIAVAVNQLAQALNTLGGAAAWKWFAGTAAGGGVIAAGKSALARVPAVGLTVGAGLTVAAAGETLRTTGQRAADRLNQSGSGVDLEASRIEVMRNLVPFGLPGADRMTPREKQLLEALQGRLFGGNVPGVPPELMMGVAERLGADIPRVFDPKTGMVRRTGAGSAAPKVPTGPGVATVSQSQLDELRKQPWFGDVDAIMQKAGISTFAWAYNAIQESGGKLGRAGDGGKSHGLFQFYERGELPGFARFLGVPLGEARKVVNDPNSQDRVAAYVAMRSKQLGLDKVTDPYEQAFEFARRFEKPAAPHLEARRRFLQPRFGSAPPVGAGEWLEQFLSKEDREEVERIRQLELGAAAMPERTPEERRLKALAQVRAQEEAAVVQRKNELELLGRTDKQIAAEVALVRKGFDSQRAQAEGDYREELKKTRREKDEATQAAYTRELNLIERAAQAELRRLVDGGMRREQAEQKVREFRARELESFQKRIATGEVSGIRDLPPRLRDDLAQKLFDAREDQKTGARGELTRQFEINRQRLEMDLAAAKTDAERVQFHERLIQLLEQEANLAGSQGDTQRELRLRDDIQSRRQAILAIQIAEAEKANALRQAEEGRLQTLREIEAELGRDRLQADRAEAEAQAAAEGPEALREFLEKRIAAVNAAMALFATPAVEAERAETDEERLVREKKLVALRQELLQLTGRLRNVTGEIAQAEQQIRDSTAAQAAERAQIAAETKLRTEELDAQLQRRQAERQGAGAVRAFLLAEIAEVETRIRAAQAILPTLAGDAADGVRANLRELQLELLDLLDEVEQHARPRWQRFWSGLAEDTKANLQGAFAGLFEGLFMGGKDLAERFFYDLRSIAARALSNILVEGATDLFRGVGRLFTGRSSASRNTEGSGQGDDLAGDITTAATSNDEGGGEKKAAPKLGQLAAAAGLAVGGIASLVAAFQKGKDGLGAAVPMMIAALVQLVLAFMVAKAQIAAGPAGLIAGAVIGLASLFGGKHADGGRPQVGKFNLVGERGPELFVPDVPGTIIPNHQLPQFALPSFSRPNFALPGGGSVNTQQRTYNDHRTVHSTTNIYGPIGSMEEVRRHEREEYLDAWRALETG